MPWLPVHSWQRLYCSSRCRMGFDVPPFRWRYLLRAWGWRCYVLAPAWRWARLGKAHR